MTILNVTGAIPIPQPTTSNSFNFPTTRDQIIRDAMLNIGAIGEAEVPTSQETSDCAYKLNMLVKQWMGKQDFAPGLKMWTRQRGDLFMSASRGQYQLGPTGDNFAAGVNGGAFNQTFNQTNLTAPVDTSTNLALYSAMNTVTGWSVTSCTETFNSIAAPDGTLTGNTITATLVGARIYNAVTLALTANTVYTATIFLQAGNSTASKFGLYDTTGVNIIGNVQFSWTAGVPAFTASTTIIAGSNSITNIGGGWYRIQFSANVGSTYNGAVLIQVFPDYTAGTKFIYCWGAQLELGNIANAYIPTGSVAALATNAYVQATTLMNVGDYIGIQTSSDLLWSTITNIGFFNYVTIAGPISNTSSGAYVWNYTTKGQRPLGIVTSVLRDTNYNDTPQDPMTIQEYEALSNKTNPTYVSDPMAFYYESQLNNGQIYLDVGGAQDITKHLHIVYMQAVMDFDNPGDSPEYPQQWYRALGCGLSRDIAPMFDCEWTQEMQANLQDALSMAREADAETTVMAFRRYDD